MIRVKDFTNPHDLVSFVNTSNGRVKMVCATYDHSMNAWFLFYIARQSDNFRTPQKTYARTPPHDPYPPARPSVTHVRTDDKKPSREIDGGFDFSEAAKRAEEVFR